MEKAKDFGVCPICGSDMGWDSDGSLEDITQDPADEDVLIRYCSCTCCGASMVIQGCSAEERKDYPYWQNSGK